MQSLAEPLPEGELDPEGQLEQVLDVVAPEVVEYLPLPQSVQDDEPACMQNIRRFSIILMLDVSDSGDELTYNHPLWCIIYLDHRRASHG